MKTAILPILALSAALTTPLLVNPEAAENACATIGSSQVARRLPEACGQRIAVAPHGLRIGRIVALVVAVLDPALAGRLVIEGARVAWLAEAWRRTAWPAGHRP